eukprot:1158239-Pelagomonas_calceolata.AAC.4
MPKYDGRKGLAITMYEGINLNFDKSHIFPRHDPKNPKLLQTIQGHAPNAFNQPAMVVFTSF